MLELSTAQQIAVWILPALLAITLHEASHALAAEKLGDHTAKMLGRLSLNPIKHIDPIGTLLVPTLVIIMTNFSFIFGWAKPVPITWQNLKSPRRDMALVALAGPMSNLLMALCWAFCMKLGYQLDPSDNNFALFMILAGRAGMIINVLLAVLNLLPIPPLDGSKVLSSALPPRHALTLYRYEHYGIFVILLLLATGILTMLILPPTNFILGTLQSVFNL